MHTGLTLSAIGCNIIFLSTIFLSNLFYYFHIYLLFFFFFSKVLTAGIMGMILVKVSSPSTTLVRTTSIYLQTLYGKMFNLQKYFEKNSFLEMRKRHLFFLATIIFVASLTKLVSFRPRDSSETFLLGAWRHGKLVGHRA